MRLNKRHKDIIEKTLTSQFRDTGVYLYGFQADERKQSGIMAPAVSPPKRNQAVVDDILILLRTI